MKLKFRTGYRITVIVLTVALIIAIIGIWLQFQKVDEPIVDGLARLNNIPKIDIEQLLEQDSKM